MNKKIVITLASLLTLGALVGCGKSSKPYDPDANPGGGGTIKKKDFAYALNYDYQSFALAYYQEYSDGMYAETAYEYHRGGKYGVTIVDDINYDESIGTVYYSYYASTAQDDYAYWPSDNYYVYSGWVANGYRDADLAMYHAYFSFYYLLDNLTVEDVEEIAGLFYVKESAIDKLNATAFQFYGNPLMGGGDLTSIAFLLDSETGLFKKIYGSVSEVSDDGIEIQIYNINNASYPTGANVPNAPYYNSESDRNIYTYQEMLGDKYVPDVWPSSVALQINETVDTEPGFDMVIDLDQSVDISYVLSPEGVNRKEYRWVVSDDEVVDLDYKYNYTTGHKYLTGVGEGVCDVYIEFQKEDGTYTKSNTLKVKVRGVKPIDKTNAVYDLTVSGGSYRTDSVTGLVDKDYTDILMNNASTLVDEAPYTIEGHNIHLLNASYTDCFGTTGLVIYASPSSQDYMNSEVGFNSYLLFDFGDQEVISLDFYYALQRSAHKGAALDALSEAYISTSIDGENWSEPVDMCEEMRNEFGKMNLDYDAHLKLMSRSFEKARQVKLFFKANMVGKNFNICMNSFVFKKDSTCHDHEIGGESVDVESVTIASSANSVKVNKTLTFSISSILPSNATNKNVTWHVSNEEYATIDANGVLTALKEGNVKVYALSVNNVKSNEIDIEIIGQEYLDERWVGIRYLASDIVENLTFYDLDFEILSTSTAKLVIKPSNGDATTINLTYDTKDTEHTCPYVFIGENSEVLHAKLSNYDDSTCEIFLSGSIISLGNSHTGQGEELTKYISSTSIVAKNAGNPLNASFEMLAGKSMSIVTVVSPNNAYNKVARATSSNPSVASISNEMIDDEPIDNVFVLEAKSVGSATITFSNGEVEAVYVVTVKEAIQVSSITLSAPKTTIADDETLQMEAILNPTNANDYKLTYSVDNSSFASINATTGLLTAKKEGSVVVTVTDFVSGKSDSLTITINKSSALVPSAYQGTWSGEDIIGYTFSFTVNANGTAKFVSLDADIELDFTLDENKSSSSTFYFVCTDGSGLTVCLYGTGSNEKTFEVDDNTDTASLGDMLIYGPTSVYKE